MESFEFYSNNWQSGKYMYVRNYVPISIQCL